MPYIIYADIESLIKIADGCVNNPENSSTTEIVGYIPCRYSMLIIWSFDHIENKHTLYPGKDCMKKFCIYLRGYAANVINFEKKKMLLLSKEDLRRINETRKTEKLREKTTERSFSWKLM